MIFGKSKREEALDALVSMASEGWLQSRAALHLASGSSAQEAADAARRDFDVRFGSRWIDISHFDLRLPRRKEAQDDADRPTR